MRAFKVLDHALHGDKVLACSQFITLGGLSPLFTAFMKKGSAKYKKEYPEYSQREEDEHCFSILCSLFLNVEQVDCRNRLVYKFLENDREKFHALLISHAEYVLLAQNDHDDYLDRLDSGLYHLQLIDTLVLFCCKESAEIKDRIPLLLEGVGSTLDQIKGIVGGKAETRGLTLRIL
jgi:beta-catenin-like protein 1